MTLSFVTASSSFSMVAKENDTWCYGTRIDQTTAYDRYHPHHLPR